jgi:hypothetical protein
MKPFEVMHETTEINFPHRLNLKIETDFELQI